MTKTFTHEIADRRYVLRIDDELIAEVDYVINGKSISFNHTYTSPKRRGNGYAAEIVQFAVDDVEASSDRRIVPMCWYVAEWFALHPDRATLLTRGGGAGEAAMPQAE